MSLHESLEIPDQPRPIDEHPLLCERCETRLEPASVFEHPECGYVGFESDFLHECPKCSIDVSGGQELIYLNDLVRCVGCGFRSDFSDSNAA